MDALIIVLVAAWTGAGNAYGRVVLSAMNAKQVIRYFRTVWTILLFPRFLFPLHTPNTQCQNWPRRRPLNLLLSLMQVNNSRAMFGEL